MLPSTPSRRVVLTGALGVTAWALTACTGGSHGGGQMDMPTQGAASGATPGPTASGRPQQPLSVPALQPEVAPVHLRLRAETGTTTIVPGLTTPVLRFGGEVLEGDPASMTPTGSYLGPTLHLRVGQRVRVTFENRLDAAASIVHWHGLDLPQGQDGQPDDAIGPGETYDYDFVVDAVPGTYWYHPHPHEITGAQVYAGLAGLLIVHPADLSAQHLPTGAHDIALVLQDRTIGADGRLQYVATMHDQMMGFVGERLVTNGVTGYTVAVERTAYRVRLLGATNSRIQYLTLSTGTPLTVVAVDGPLLPEPIEWPAVVLTPAQRTDLWVDFSTVPAGARVDLLANGQVAATFVVGEGAATPGKRPGPAAASEIERVDVDPGAAVNADAPKEFVLATSMMRHEINGRQWQGREVEAVETVRAGTIELWDFVNQSPMPHPMHLHGRHFRVVQRTWENQAASAQYEQVADGVIDGLRDTVLVWPGQRVRIAAAFGRHLGYYLYHCHNLEHEDAGMMRCFRIT